MSAPGRDADRITYVGHATVRLDLGETSLLTDPALRAQLLLGLVRRQAGPPPAHVLRGLDALLVSHLHPDHLDFPSLRPIRGEVPVLAPQGAGRTLRRRGFPVVTELAPGEATTVGAVEIGAVPAVHDGRRYKVGPRVEAIGFDIRAGEQRVYFAGDTDLFDGMKELRGKVDVAMLPVGGWGPTIGRGHLDPRRAAEAAAMIRPRIAIPIHWGTFLRAEVARRRPDLLTEPPRAFAAELAKRAPEVEARALAPGESLRLEA